MEEYTAIDTRFTAMHNLSRSTQPPTLEERLAMLDKLMLMQQKNKDNIVNAIEQDFGTRGVIVSKMADVMLCVNSIRYIKKHLKQWIQPVHANAEFPFGMLGKGYSIFQPKGVVLVSTPWNYPMSLPLMGLADALAAGNRVIIKPSEFTPNTSELLKKMISEVFDPNQVDVITGDYKVSAQLCSLPFDHILFTGSPAVGKKVMQAAAANLTPVTLELGGKCPVIIADDYDIKKAAGDIINGKLGNAGQACVTADYVLIPRGTESEFVEACKDLVKKHWPNMSTRQDYCSIINERNYDRIANMAEDAQNKGATLVDLASDHAKFNKSESLKFPPKIVLNTKDEMTVMQEEIFGPLLPVMEYDSIDETIKYINERDRPLALYVYTNKNEIKNQVLNSTTSGGVCVNGLMYQYMVSDLGFGGIGNSGMGAYHGIRGFRALSHRKPIFIRNNKSTGKPGPPDAKAGSGFDKMIETDIGALLEMGKIAGMVAGVLGVGLSAVWLARRRGLRIPKIKIMW